MSESKISKVWHERVLAPEMPRGIINQFCQCVAPMSYGYTPGGKRTALTYGEAADVMNQFEARVRMDGGPLVTAEQAAVGREWLVKYWKRLKLPQLDYSTITEFRLCNALMYASNGWRKAFGPEYAAYFPNGDVFRYAPTAWQAQMYDKAGLPTWELVKA